MYLVIIRFELRYVSEYSQVTCGFPRSLQEGIEIASYNKPQPLPLASFQMYLLYYVIMATDWFKLLIRILEVQFSIPYSKGSFQTKIF
jgi:hypothetical protein